MFTATSRLKNRNFFKNPLVLVKALISNLKIKLFQASLSLAIIINSMVKKINRYIKTNADVLNLNAIWMRVKIYVLKKKLAYVYK